MITRDSKLQLIRACLENKITPEEIEKKYAVNRLTIEDWINTFFNEAGRFFENENLIKDIDCKLKTMSETIKEKEKIISCLERDNYELKKIIYTFEEDND
jgi:transposase-like protein